MKKLFSKKEIFKVKSIPYDPDSMAEPATADEFRKRGTAHYARKQYEAAAADLEQAIFLKPDHIDTHYTMGLVYKAMQRDENAVSSFTTVLGLINADPNIDKVRNDMLRRLALGHINSITQGDWNLEKEIWKRKT